MLLEDGLRMSVRDPGSLSRANCAYLAVDHFSRGWGFMKKKKCWGRGVATRRVSWEGFKGWELGFRVQGLGVEA